MTTAEETHLWDEYVAAAKEINPETLAAYELNYKRDIADRFAEARLALLAGQTAWVDLLDRALRNTEGHPVDWRLREPFRKWLTSHPDEVADPLRVLWEETHITIGQKIERFINELPEEALLDTRVRRSGPATVTSLVSVLLMGLAGESFPPYNYSAMNGAYKRTGFSRGDDYLDEAMRYEHELAFLERLISESRNRSLILPNRAYAQSIVWHLERPPKEESPAVRDITDSTYTTSIVKPPAPSREQLASSLYLPPEFLETIDTLLEEKKQVIFQGPPGTGKTYVAQALAEHLAGSSGRVTLVQFHPSYSYEDFVQGYRPTLKDGQPGFELRDGPLLRAAEQARQNSNANHYLIIDEINRGNIANVFGELYFLLEYRDKEINLQYDDKPFSLPDNLFIIGTMNTADRSIALVDLALRRRFYFVPFHPDDEPVQSVLRKYLEAQGLEEMLWVADVVEAANEKLREDRHAAIGPSYFMRDNLNEETVERIWKHSVLPYIEERRFGGNAVSDEFSLSSLRRDVSGNSAPIESIIQDAEITEDEANTGE